jgi:aspartyl-tRNA(Asn)/glutamyl-tRNA(Gln) amidotransferase subunit B
MPKLNTKIGLEIHVQLKTKSKMFCGCDNNAEGKKPNTVVCPICLGLPGTLPVANEQAILWTIKTGLVLNCQINKVSKFDRKHYFYPDLPKGYQISQYDEPFCSGGYLEVDGSKVRLNRIHLEEDAGKLVHSGDKSLVDLNRAGTPLMEIVTEPDITSPTQAGEFLRKLQKIVRDVVEVSEASMEKGHLRCDANISVNDGNKMSPIVELKNINSFRFVEKALTLVQAKLEEEYADWPVKSTKETWGYDSVNNKVYLQRRKEEAADYRYFPEPDLPPIDTSKFDLEALKKEIGKSHEEKVNGLIEIGVRADQATALTQSQSKHRLFESISFYLDNKYNQLLATAINQNFFNFSPISEDFDLLSKEYAKAIIEHWSREITKNEFIDVIKSIHDNQYNYGEAKAKATKGCLNADELMIIIDEIVLGYSNEAIRYQNGEKQLFGFFMGELMKRTNNRANPSIATKILKEKLEK